VLIVTEQDQDGTAKSQVGMPAYVVMVMQPQALVTCAITSWALGYCPLPFLLREIGVVG
jgi:hypothetical protein